MNAVITDSLASAQSLLAPIHTRGGFRTVAGRFATGVAVAATWVDDTPVGMTVNSFATVSLEPMLLLVCLHKRSRLITAVARSGTFAVTILAANQRQCARWFATSSRPAGLAEFANVAYHRDAGTGCPLLSDGVAYFGCTVYERLPAGDHIVLIGEARSCGLLRPAPPLLFVDGRYADVIGGGEQMREDFTSLAGATGLQRLALTAAKAGARAISESAQADKKALTFKNGGSQDPVTSADLASERAIRTSIATSRADDAIRSEESGDISGTSGIRWVVDPLDGTVNFTHGLDRYAVSVAAEACSSGQVAAAAIVQPATGSWLALSGNDVAGSPGHIRVTACQASDALLSFAVPSQPEPRRAAFCLLASVVPHVQDLRNFGSTVCDLAAVAIGEIDGFISFDAHAWDVAAGIALVIASGGSVMRWRHAGGLDVLVLGGAAVVEQVSSWIDS